MRSRKNQSRGAIKTNVLNYKVHKYLKNIINKNKKQFLSTLFSLLVLDFDIVILRTPMFQRK